MYMFYRTIIVMVRSCHNCECCFITVSVIIVIVNLLVMASLLAASPGNADAVIVFDVIGVFDIVFVVFIAVADAFEVF